MLQTIVSKIFAAQAAPGAGLPGPQKIPVLTRNERLLVPDPAMRMANDHNGTSIHVNASVQSLLNLESRTVRLNRAAEPHDFTAPPQVPHDVQPYNSNIPVEDRRYIHASHEDLVRQYVDKIRGFKFADHPSSDMTPFDRLSQKILFALDQTPGRNEDSVFIKGAFFKLHDFYIEHNHAIAEAVRRHPELRDIINNTANETTQRIVIAVLTNNQINDEPLEIETIIRNAQTIAVAIHDEPLLQQTRTYYSTDGCVAGAGPSAKRVHIRELSEGRVVFPNLAALLRYAPAGRIDISVSKNTQEPPPRDGHGQWIDLSITVAYPSGLIKKLYYMENPNTPQRKRVHVLMGTDSYQPQGLFPLDLSQDVPPGVRAENLKSLETLIRAAKVRQG
jgi:hypothetical protein